MKRLGLIFLLAAVAAGGIYYGSHRVQNTRPATVTTLLPASTVAFAHVPDFKRIRDEWRESDIYKLYQEQAVQDFLKPLSIPQRGATSDTLSDLDLLDPKDVFLAVTLIENDNPHFVGGFRFSGSQASAEEIIGKWRSRLVHNNSTREAIDYETHKVDIVGAAPNQIATVYAGQWLFASNDLAELKAVLDRADGRAKDPKLTLEADETFRGAMAHMPSSYGLLFYFQPKRFSPGILANAAGPSLSGDARAALEQLQSVCGATKFDKGKIHDVLFVGTPKLPLSPELTRNSLKLGTADTFLYVVALLNPDRLAGIGQTGNALALGSWLQKVFDVALRTGVTPDEWKAAFDLEASALAEWPQTAHLPSVVTVLPVKDPARALKIADALTKAIDEDAPWRKADKNGVRYYYMQSPVALFAITPTIAVSNRQMIIGLDSVSVEAAMSRSVTGASSSKSASLADSSAYSTAANSILSPTTGFVYIDTALLYSRLDAALRPMLLMSAAFMPAMSDYIDATKLPPSDTVTKHLSPIVLAQRYERDGYVTESIGPVTLDIGVVLPAIGWILSREKTP
jgi:hypothetical protein